MTSPGKISSVGTKTCGNVAQGNYLYAAFYCFRMKAGGQINVFFSFTKHHYDVVYFVMLQETAVVLGQRGTDSVVNCNQ